MHSFRVKILDVHPSRFKFYADSSLEVTKELVEHVAAQGIFLRVHEFKDHQRSERNQDFKILVQL